MTEKPQAKKSPKDLRVCDLMSSPVITVRPDQPLPEALAMVEVHRIRHLPVASAAGELIGLITERDLTRAALLISSEVTGDGFPPDAGVKDFMIEDVRTAAPEDTAKKAAAVLLDKKWGCLPVVEGKKVVGIITEADFVRYFAQLPD